jgi:hypothetical protein
MDFNKINISRRQKCLILGFSHCLALQRTGRTAGGSRVIDPVEHLWRFHRPPLSLVG